MHAEHLARPRANDPAASPKTALPRPARPVLPSARRFRNEVGQSRHRRALLRRRRASCPASDQHRPALLSPSSGPPATIKVALAPHRSQGRQHAGLQRAQRLRPAVGARWRQVRPGFLLKPTWVSALGTPGTSSGQVRPSPAGIPAAGEVESAQGVALQGLGFMQGVLCKAGNDS
jgi:hypothetical protein